MKLRFLYLTLFCVVLILTVSTPGFAKDTWINVRSKNFFMIGNASEKEIRQVATKLEQFRETFRLLFPKAKFNQTIQTNVVVFKSDSAYRPFKPKRADGKPDDGIAGYFQPGEDLNYITLSTEGEKEDTYNTIFHEYVHFLLDTNFGKSEVPPWFNEGLAEYYSTFRIEDDQKVTLGGLENNHLYLLQQSQLIPLKTFFEIDNYSLHQNGNHSRSIFYAQAWALIHYLIQGNNGANTDAMNKFLNLVMNKVEPEKAFQQVFQYDYATMEKALKKYVSQSSYRVSLATFKNKLIFDTEMTTVPLAEAEANAYLGDLLYHTHEYDTAETYLQKAVALDADSSLANTSLGLVKMRQRKFDEAKKYLEKAIAGDQKNHFAHYNYAYILSREGMDEFGYVSKFAPETVKKMRESLQKAIAINPNFTESYHLLGFINLVNNENLEETVTFLKKALQLQPGNQEYAFIIAQIYMRQEKYAEAKELADKIYKTADEPDLRAKAQSLLNSLSQFEEKKAFYEKQQKELEDKGIRAPVLVKRTAEKPLTEAEVAKIKEENAINDLNRAVLKPKPDEKQVVGYLEKVACVKGEITYTVKTDTETFTFTTKDFSSLDLMSMIEEAQNMDFGCDAKVKDYLAVLNYRPATDPKAKSRGNLMAITFVPKFFRLKTEEEMKEARQVMIVEEEPTREIPPQVQEDMEKKRREAMLENIKQNLRTPLDGEKREIGIVDKIECSNNSIVFFARIGIQTLKLKAKSPQDVKIMSFTPDAGGLQFGCGVKLPPLPVVITYRPKDKDGGEMVALEFVPKSFKLD
ncbi:MAG TPA: tetratricopeptide repeat protein [Pyrinomonadaceae bacterium]|jgi:tetratricopeptide (TPR) repeat protein|nr:tetratricopeptide repeat protein [Pyrinomonadaceae bacterium]